MVRTAVITWPVAIDCMWRVISPLGTLRGSRSVPLRTVRKLTDRQTSPLEALHLTSVRVRAFMPIRQWEVRSGNFLAMLKWRPTLRREPCLGVSAAKAVSWCQVSASMPMDKRESSRACASRHAGGWEMRRLGKTAHSGTAMSSLSETMQLCRLLTAPGEAGFQPLGTIRGRAWRQEPGVPSGRKWEVLKEHLLVPGSEFVNPTDKMDRNRSRGSRREGAPQTVEEPLLAYRICRLGYWRWLFRSIC